jgi:hypothetical protein
MTQFNSNPADREPDSVATPEGDGEFDGTEPLQPGTVEASVAGLQVPPGSAPAAYDTDQPSELGELIEAVDRVSRGKVQP